MLFFILMGLFVLGTLACKCWGEAEKNDSMGLFITSITIWMMVFLGSLATNKYWHLVLY